MVQLEGVPAVEVRGLVKGFGEKVVLDGVDLAVPRGTVYALLGPNGAGKTTFVRVLTTLLRPRAGRAAVCGLDVVTQAADVRRRIGVTGQFSAVDVLLSGDENLRLMADLYHLPRALGRARRQELLERFDLVDSRGKVAALYSGGMRRRLDLAMTLMGDPEVIFLDEPTASLDPRSRRTMWQIVDELVAAGTTVLLTTQYLEEADRLAHRIGVLDRGRLVAEGSAAELKALVDHDGPTLDDVFLALTGQPAGATS